LNLDSYNKHKRQRERGWSLENLDRRKKKKNSLGPRRGKE
jgi:hypothetical protein